MHTVLPVMLKLLKFYIRLQQSQLCDVADAEQEDAAGDLEENSGVELPQGSDIASLESSSDKEQSANSAANSSAGNPPSHSRAVQLQKRPTKLLYKSSSGSSSGSQSSGDEASRPKVRQPRVDRKQKQPDHLIKGLGKALSSTTAKTERAATQRHREMQREATQRHREMQRQQMYAAELRSYNCECKKVSDINKMAKGQRLQTAMSLCQSMSCCHTCNCLSGLLHLFLGMLQAPLLQTYAQPSTRAAAGQGLTSMADSLSARMPAAGTAMMQ